MDDTPAQLRARALKEMAADAAGSSRNPRRRQPLFTVHTTVDTLAGTGDPADWKLAVEHQWRSVIPLDAAAGVVV